MSNPIRFSSFDTITGILIIHMILGHVFQITNLTDSYIYSLSSLLQFFMPWFFFKSGYFHKNDTFSSIFHKSIKKLLIPFAIFCAIGHLVYCFINFFQGDTNWQHYILSPFKSILLLGSVTGNLPLWFLLALFFVKLLFCSTWEKAKWLLIPILAIAPILYIHQIEYPRLAASISSGLFFYIMGYLLKNYKPKPTVSIVFLISYLLCWIYLPAWVDMNTNELLSGYYFLWYPTSLLGIISINSFFQNFRIKIPFIQQIGSYSMAYYISHWIILLLISSILPQWYNNYIKAIILIISCAIILPLIAKSYNYDKMKWIWGR